MSRTRIGILSDTHGQLHPLVIAALEGVDHLIHAGDVGSPEVLQALRTIAPLTAVRGNMDRAPLVTSLPSRETVEIAGVRVLVGHIIEYLLKPEEAAADGYQVVVSGHTHAPRIHRLAGVLFVNPGSAGPRRFRQPRALARLTIEDGVPQAEIVVVEPGSSASRPTSR